MTTTTVLYPLKKQDTPLSHTQNQAKWLGQGGKLGLSLHFPHSGKLDLEKILTNELVDQAKINLSKIK